MAAVAALHVAGGVYVESCLTPPSTALLGSAGRAAMAVAGLAPSVALHTFYPAFETEDVVAAFAPLGIEPVVHSSLSAIRFDYLHPLSRPRISPIPLPNAGTAPVEGDVVLRFGCLEGGFRVTARTAVYDPQSGTAPEEFAANGSRAERLALVMNRGELHVMSGLDDLAAAAASVLAASGAAVLLAKAGADGAFVFEAGGEMIHVPAYEASTIYKIGSGDVFSAAFALHWGLAGMPAALAADLASLRTAAYVETRILPSPDEVVRRRPLPRVGVRERRVYLAGPFFTAPQVWLVEEARDALLDLGVRVFSPYHDVGLGPPDMVAPADLRGLTECDVVLALLPDMDPGTVFECGYARSLGKPVVAYVEAPRPQDPSMLVGTGSVIEPDFATALHRAAWI